GAPAPNPLPPSAGQWPAPSWRRSPDSAPPAPPFAPGPVGAEARPAAARAPTPALCSASRRSASDPSSTVGHLPNGKVSCPNHAADSYPKLVLYNIPLHVVRDLVPLLPLLQAPRCASDVRETYPNAPRRGS